LVFATLDSTCIVPPLPSCVYNCAIPCR